VRLIPLRSNHLVYGKKSMARTPANATGTKKLLEKYKPPKIRNSKKSVCTERDNKGWV